MYSSDRMRRNEILMIFFRHYVERPAKTVTMTHCLNSVLPMIDWTMQTHGAD